jgi:hypothetical protein
MRSRELVTSPFGERQIRTKPLSPKKSLPCAGRRGRLKVLKISPGRQSHKH